MALTLSTSAIVAASSAVAAPPVQTSNLTDAQVNRSLDKLAKKLAAGVGRPDVRSSIHASVKKRFDGDTEALWSSLAKDSTFADKVVGKGRGSDDLTATAAKIPRLQVAVPAHFESWSPSTYAPLVAYFPEGVDDTTVETITAYDAAGQAVELDAQVEPERPVIVVGLNERTDDDGDLVTSQAVSTAALDITQSSVTAAAAAKYSVDIVVVELEEDKEPWAKGDAEISMRAKSRGCSGTNFEDGDWKNLNNNGDVWAPAGGRNLGSTTCDVVFAWWEDDGGAFDYTLSYDKFSLGIAMDDSDDMIGKKQLSHGSFKGGTMSETQWSALEMWTE